MKTRDRRSGSNQPTRSPLLHPLFRHRYSIICHILFIAFPVALLWQPLLAGEAFFWGTPLLQFVPWQQLAADIWRSGHLPLWNPLVGCGAPLAANYQTAAFYPLNALHLLLPAEIALSWTTALHLGLAGWGMYRWGRAVGLDRFPASIGAMALQGSGFLVGRVALFPSITVTFPWIPIWLWRTELLIKRGMRHPGPRNAELQDALWLGLTIGLGLLAGHAQTAFYGALLVAGYWVFRTIQDLSIRKQKTGRHGSKEQGLSSTKHLVKPIVRVAGLILLSSAVGLGLAAVQLLPTAELLLHSQRSTGVNDSLALTYSLWPWRLITIAAPAFFGNPGAGNYWGYGAHWEDAAYVGLLPLLLAARAVIQAFSRSQKRAQSGRQETTAPAHVTDNLSTGFWAASALMALVLALGDNTPVFPFLFRHVPGFDLFQAPARWLAVTTVALSALAGIGAQQWPHGPYARRRGGVGAAVGGALLIGGLVAPSLLASVPPTFGPATVRLGTVLILVSILLLLGEQTRRKRRRDALWWRAAMGAFVALDLLTFAWPLVPTVDRTLYQGNTQTAEILHSKEDAVRIYWPSDPTHQNQKYDAHYDVKFDYLTFDDFGPTDVAHWRGMREDQLPNTGMLDDVASANNFDPLLVEAYVDLLEATVETPGILKSMGVTHIASNRPWPGSEQIHAGKSAAFYRLPSAPGRAWLVPHARLVASDQMLAAMQTPSFDPTATVLIETDSERESGSTHRLGTTCDLAHPRLALQDDPNRVTIEAALDIPGYLVLADTWYPGWRVTVDGEPAELLRANHAFRAVRLTTGKHTVEMVYRPISVLVGGITSLVTGALSILRMFVSRREKP